MIICILAKNENIEEVRTKGVEANLNLGSNLLSIPLSENGENPITHWFCYFKCTKEMFDRLIALKNFSEMEESDPKSFLKTKNLKIVR